jgi:NitT/TauT family transport system substrate-binding protein
MHRREFIGLSLAAGLAVSGLGGCSRRKPLRFGVHPWIGYEPLYLAEEFGWLSDDVTLIKGQSSADSIDGLQSGTLAGAALTLDEAIRVHVEGPELYVVGVADVSAGADVLIVRPGIHSIDELRGKRIATELGGVSGTLLLTILDRADIAPEQVVIVDLPVDEHLDAWKRNEVDASVCYEPVASLLEEAGGERLFDSSMVPDTIFDVLVVTREEVRSNPQVVPDLLEAHFSGLRYLVRNMYDSVYRVAARQGVSPDDVRSALATVMLPDLAANRRYLETNGRIDTVARHLSRLLLGEGLMSRALTTPVLSNDAFLPGDAS